VAAERPRLDLVRRARAARLRVRVAAQLAAQVELLVEWLPIQSFASQCPPGNNSRFRGPRVSGAFRTAVAVEVSVT
jgi:hypothetical protein